MDRANDRDLLPLFLAIHTCDYITSALMQIRYYLI